MAAGWSTRRSGAFRCVADGVVDAPGARTGKLLVRPEAIAIGDTTENLTNRIRVSIEEASFVGPVSQIRVRALAQPDVTLMVKLPSRASGFPLGIGSETVVSWSERECHLVTT